MACTAYIRKTAKISLAISGNIVPTRENREMIPDSQTFGLTESPVSTLVISNISILHILRTNTSASSSKIDCNKSSIYDAWTWSLVLDTISISVFLFLSKKFNYLLWYPWPHFLVQLILQKSAAIHSQLYRYKYNYQFNHKKEATVAEVFPLSST